MKPQSSANRCIHQVEELLSRMGFHGGHVKLKHDDKKSGNKVLGLQKCPWEEQKLYNSFQTMDESLVIPHLNGNTSKSWWHA